MLEYTPPEHVQSEMERLLELYNETTNEHPVVRAAWLHHRFIRIHPFEDGNGRVARALTLLVLLRARYAPLVVDRTQRGTYLEALDQANAGDLRDLVRLFARLEIVALRSELERPAEPTAEGAGALAVARAYAQRLRDLQRAQSTERAANAEALASGLHEKVAGYLEELGVGIRDQFREADPQAQSSVYDAKPPDERARYWQKQIIRTAREVDFFTNLSNGSWWTLLQLVVLGQTLRFVVVIQRVGHGESGVLAVTVFAEALGQISAGLCRPLLVGLEAAAATAGRVFYPRASSSSVATIQHCQSLPAPTASYASRTTTNSPDLAPSKRPTSIRSHDGTCGDADGTAE